MITDWTQMPTILWVALQQTGQMVSIALIFTMVFGIAIGVLLVGTDTGGILAEPLGSAQLGRLIHSVLGFVVNVGRSLPFIILMVLLIPLSRVLVGTSIGSAAATVPLTVAAIPFFARLVEIALREVDEGLVEAAKALGARRGTIIAKVLLAEARPAIVLGLSTSVISMINYSAIAGTIGGGGIGDIAIRYGYERYSVPYLVITAAILILTVQIIQILASAAVRRLSHR